MIELVRKAHKVHKGGNPYSIGWRCPHCVWSIDLYGTSPDFPPGVLEKIAANATAHLATHEEAA